MISTHFSVHVSLQNRQGGSKPVASYTKQIIDWYTLGANDYKDVSNFTMTFDKIHEWFDISYTSHTVSETLNMRLADLDVDGDFPLRIDGEAYYIIGHIITKQ